MYSTDLRFYTRVRDFATVVARANGGEDIAKLVDSVDSLGADVFEAHADVGTMRYGNGTIVRAERFGEVHAFASDDGRTDTAHLYDTTEDRETSFASWFKGRHGDSKMYTTIPWFFNRAKGFDEVTASVQGGDDIAQLYDSTDADTYWSRPDHSKMKYGDGTFTEALNFRYMLGYAENGTDPDENGLDTATLYDETAAGTSYATHFCGYATWGRLFADSYGFYSRTQDFDELHAVLGGEDDLVRLYDDPARVDHLMVTFPGDGDHDPCKARFSNDRRQIYIDDFLALAAFTCEQDVDECDVDEAYHDEVFLYGDWHESP
jgi:hypothetical protein